MSRLRYNGLSTTLGASLTSSATAVTFGAALTHSNGTAVPTISGSNYIPLVILDSNGHESEIVYLTAYTSGQTTGTISRGQEGTTGIAHNSGDKVVSSPTVQDFSQDARWLPQLGTTSIDEFDAGSLDPAWVRVDAAAAANAVWTEAADVLSGRHTAVADGVGMAHALMRPVSSVAVGDAFGTCVTTFGFKANLPVVGVMVADGVTSGSGAQVASLSYSSGGASTVDTRPATGYTISGTAGGVFSGAGAAPGSPMFMRLVYSAANTWRTDISPDGVSWLSSATITNSIVPTYAGIYLTSWDSTTQFVASFEFFRRYSGVS